MENSILYRDWYEQVVLPPTNDYLICISASSRTPVSGTGKTTLGGGIAKELDRSEGGFDAENQATLNAEKFANTVIPEAPHKAAVVMDESQGTPGGGSGMNRMRAMSQSTLEAVGSLLANRDKNLTVILIVQRIGMLFSDLYPLIDSWLLISKAPGQVGGPEAKHHKMFVEDYPDGGGGLRTPIVEFLDWPALPEDEPEYKVLEEKKAAAKTKGSDDADDDGELEDSAQVALAQALADNGVPMYKIPQKSDKLTYSKEWYRQRIDKKEDSAANREGTA